tara:strand:- start:535 stop:960 length:426 start_codon:yes stop_codon:yes gene_type:complete
MQLTKYTDLSLRVLMHLALQRDAISRIKDIAESYNVSRNHLVKVVHNLSTLGYIHSTQGRNGGIRLAVSPDDIVVGDIVRAVEPSLCLIDCESQQCPISSACLLKEALDEAMSTFLKTLDGYTVSDLVRNKPQLLKLIRIA